MKETNTAGSLNHSAFEAEVLSRAREVFRLEGEAVATAGTLVDRDFVEAVRAVLETEGRVCCTGVGKAGIIGQKIQATLASTGTLSYFLHPNDALHGDLGMVNAKDVVLAFSRSGSSEISELLALLRPRVRTIVLVSAEKVSPSAKYADYVLCIGTTPEACPLGLAPSSSTSAMLAVGDALAFAAMEQRRLRPADYAAFHPGGALGRALMKTRAIMRSGADCPRVQQNATLDDYFHAIQAAPRRAGCVTVVDPNDVVLGIVTQGDFVRHFMTQKLDRADAVTKVMTPKPKTIHVEDLVTNAVEIMTKSAIDELPVVDDEHRLVGLIDVQDLVTKGFYK